MRNVSGARAPSQTPLFTPILSFRKQHKVLHARSPVVRWLTTGSQRRRTRASSLLHQTMQGAHRCEARDALYKAMCCAMNVRTRARKQQRTFAAAQGRWAHSSGARGCTAPARGSWGQGKCARGSGHRQRPAPTSRRFGPGDERDPLVMVSMLFPET